MIMMPHNTYDILSPSFSIDKSCNLHFYIFTFLHFFLAVAPNAVVTPSVKTVTEGGNVTLTCNVSGVPSPSVEWTKTGNNTVLSVDKTFTIYNVSRVPGNTARQYQCTASNGVGSPAHDTADITVQCKYQNISFYWQSQVKRLHNVSSIPLMDELHGFIGFQEVHP